MSSDGPLVNIKLAPGIYKNSTVLGAEGRYVDADKVRFHYGNPQKVGGCVTELTQQFDATASVHFTGIARDVIEWQNNEADKSYLGVATHKKLEIFYGGQIYDITPIRVTTSTSVALTTSVSSHYVLASITAHAAGSGDYFILQSVASSVGGISFSGQYEITSVVDANSFIFDAITTATATSAAGGGNMVFSFLLNNGLPSNTAAIGYGSGGYGRQGYGTPLSVASGTNAKLDQWTLENWGEDLLACRRGGRIYTWVENNGLTATAVNRASVRATLVTASPSIVNDIIVSQPSRYLIALGATDLTGSFDPLLVRWSNQEDYTVWDPTVSVAGGNTAGSQRIKGGSQIVGGVQTRGQILIITDAPVHVMQYTNNEFVFSFEQVADNAGAISQHSMIDVQGNVFWMGSGDFHKYDGRVQTMPCDVQEAIFKPGNTESINFNQKEKVFAGLNSQFNEVIWLYPSSASDECDRYVMYNYLENSWYDGTFDRTVWVDSGVFEKPYAIDSSGTLFIQEEGSDNGAQAMPFYLQTSDFDLKDGEDFMFIDKVVPDFRFIPANKQLNFFITTRRYPQDPNPVVKGPFAVQSDTKKISMRARGRQANIRIESSANGVDFEMGTLKMNMIPDGKR